MKISEKFVWGQPPEPALSGVEGAVQPSQARQYLDSGTIHVERTLLSTAFDVPPSGAAKSAQNARRTVEERRFSAA